MTAFRIVASIISLAGLSVGFIVILLKLGALQKSVDELKRRPR